jgi:ATP-binding cassette subfamily C protein
MNKPEVMESSSAISGLMRQAMAFVHDFATFAGLSGIFAAALAVLAAAFEGVGLLLLVPLLSIVTASDVGAGWTHRLAAQAFEIAGAQTRTARLTLLLGLFAALLVIRTIILGGLKLAAGQNRQANFVAEFTDSLDRLKCEQLAYIGEENRNRVAASVIAGLVGAVIAFVGLVLLDVQAAVILTMLFIFSRISVPAMQMSQMLQQFAGTVPAHAEFLQLEHDLAVQDAIDTRPAPAIVSGTIVFRDVSFHYDRSSRAGAGIERLNLTIPPGTFLGVSGPTGAGKTTFADLLIGLIEPDSGEIAVGGVTLRGAAAIKWRDQISYVVQDPYLFRDTIRRNLLWANPRASESQIWDALAIAGVDDFVAGLTAGLDTVLGERGTLISGGERQRLCLARAVLRRPLLFVLDEATSAIDVPTERKIIKAMLDLKPRPTIVMIAHRDQSLASCDRMLRLQSGRAVADEPALTG